MGEAHLSADLPCETSKVLTASTNCYKTNKSPLQDQFSYREGFLPQSNGIKKGSPFGRAPAERVRGGIGAVFPSPSRVCAPPLPEGEAHLSADLPCETSKVLTASTDCRKKQKISCRGGVSPPVNEVQNLMLFREGRPLPYAVAV